MRTHKAPKLGPRREQFPLRSLRIFTEFAHEIYAAHLLVGDEQRFGSTRQDLYAVPVQIRLRADIALHQAPAEALDAHLLGGGV